MKDKRINITVHTVPNGYTLNVSGKEYMYFNQEMLMAGIFSHLALGMKNDIANNIILSLMEAASQWPTAGEAITANAQLISERKNAQRNERVARKQLSQMEKKYQYILKSYTDAKRLITFHELKIKELEKELKRLTKRKK